MARVLEIFFVILEKHHLSVEMIQNIALTIAGRALYSMHPC